MDDLDLDNLYNKLHDRLFRKKLRDNPASYTSELGYKIAKDTEIVVLTNTKNTIYLPMLTISTMPEDLSDIYAAGNCAGSVGSLTSASTFGCATTSISTAGTGSSVGSAGSAKLCNG